MEEILISPVHALLQVWQVWGGQYKYTGHCCNFPRETAYLHNRLPLLPQEAGNSTLYRTPSRSLLKSLTAFRDMSGALQDTVSKRSEESQTQSVALDSQRRNEMSQNSPWILVTSILTTTPNEMTSFSMLIHQLSLLVGEQIWIFVQ